jgi:hypothetical protein
MVLRRYLKRQCTCRITTQLPSGKCEVTLLMKLNIDVLYVGPKLAKFNL